MKNHKRTRASNIFFLITILVVTALCPQMANGGELSVKPAIILREEYDNNIFLTQSGKVDDFISRVIPSVTLSYKTPVWDLTLNDTLTWWYYAKQEKGYYSNDGNLSSKLAVIRNLLYFDVTDTYSSVVLNPRGPSTTTNLNVNRTDSNVADATPYIKYKIDPTITATGGFTYTNIWYRSGGADNRQQYKGFLTLERGFSPRLNALIRAEYLADRPTNATTEDNQTAVSASVFYELNPQTKIDGTAGYRWINFSDGPNHDSAIYNVGVAYRLSARGEVQLRASQSIGFSPTQGVVENTMQQLLARYGESVSVNGGIYHTRDNYFEIGQTNDAVGVTAGLTYAPDIRMTYRISGRYEKGRFMPQDEDRNVYGASAGIEYRLAKKATVSLTDDYSKSSGQIESDNFIDNIVAIQLRIEL